MDDEEESKKKTQASSKNYCAESAAYNGCKTMSDRQYIKILAIIIRLVFYKNFQSSFLYGVVREQSVLEVAEPQRTTTYLFGESSYTSNRHLTLKAPFDRLFAFRGIEPISVKISSTSLATALTAAIK